MDDIGVMDTQTDPYWKLRPEGPTPDDELCSCTDSPPIVLQEHLSSVPLACLKCNGEVPPERIGFSEELAEKIAFWRDLHYALKTLWLDSGEYEAWAKARLEDPAGSLAVRGLEIVAELNAFRRTYYSWFEDQSVEDYEPMSPCPRCGGELVPRFKRRVCEECSIAGWSEWRP
jgi:hypothetical protein